MKKACEVRRAWSKAKGHVQAYLTAPKELMESVMAGRCAHTSAVSYLHEAEHGAGQNVEGGTCRYSMDATISLFTSFVPGMCS